MSFNSQIQQDSVQGFITLYELDARKLGGEVYRFHGHNDGIITWQGQEFTPIAIKADGLEMRSDGKASTPKLTIGDNINGIQGAVSALCRLYDDFAHAKLTVTHTLAEYLDSTDTQNYRQQEWYVEQKPLKTQPRAWWSLSCLILWTLQGKKIPLRNITTYCNEAVCGRYHGEVCGYTGAARFTIDGRPTDDPALDRCGGSLADCKLRANEDSFCGFPAAGLV